jgi:D-alanine-D-alanine ligase
MDLRELEEHLTRFNPQIVFNLLEEFRGEAVFDFHLVSFLEAFGVPFTGCNPRGLVMSRNKYLAGRIAENLEMDSPKSSLMPSGQPRIPKLPSSFPLFVKLNREHASLGIRDTNKVQTLQQLKRTCDRMRENYGGEILIQQFIPGQDASVSVWGNSQVTVFGPRLLHMGGHDRVATERLKFNRRMKARAVEFKSPLSERLQSEAKLLYQRLDLSGYARFDYRISSENVPYLLDINPNPNLAHREDFAMSVKAAGWSYPEMIEQIVRFGLSYKPNV